MINEWLFSSINKFESKRITKKVVEESIDKKYLLKEKEK